jgi:cysteine desulfurase
MSTNRRVYLDHNATSPLIPVAEGAMAAAMRGRGGNPSSIHAEGRAARDVVERARNQVAALVGRPREQIVFTSGGTEANALGVAALAAHVEALGLPRVLVTTPYEHPSLRAPIAALAARGWTVQYTANHASVAAYALVNHELGSLQTLAAPLVHLDAVQAAGKLPLPAAQSLAISAHKLGGPQGVGALAISIDGTGLPRPGSAAEGQRGVVDTPETGGHQERGRRAGTENVVGIAGFGAAAAAADPSTWPTVTALGDALEAGLRALGAVIYDATPRVGGTINARFPGCLGESIVIALDLAGIAASTGAACTSGSVQPSPVLLALGLSPAEARSAVRFSLGRSNTLSEVETVLALLPPILARARLGGDALAGSR